MEPGRQSCGDRLELRHAGARRLPASVRVLPQALDVLRLDSPAFVLGDDPLKLELIDARDKRIRRAREEVDRAEYLVAWARHLGQGPLPFL